MLLFSFLLPFVLTLTLTALGTKFLIPLLKRRKAAQTILEIGPAWHKPKEGTPTMGGISFLLAVLCVLSGVCGYFAAVQTALPTGELLLTAGFALANGAIGFFDDAEKVFKKQNKGLSARAKFALQAIAAALYLVGMQGIGALSTELALPFGKSLDMGLFYYPFAFFLLTGTVNSVNLTDGIDGLASAVTLVAAGVFSLLSAKAGNTAALIFSAAIMGGCMGFLLYNAHPARIFMGDTGSLFLGGAVAGLAFLLDAPLLLLPIGIVYFLEALSVILQVASFRLFRRRIFRMAPFHHHLERCGWSENKIVLAAAALSVLGGMVAYLLY